MALRLRVSTVRRGGKTYRYHQLVRSVRRDGRPTHEVVAHLGRLSPEEVEALQDGLGSLRPEGASDTARLLLDLREVRARAALQYLDLRVVHELWRAWGLREFLRARLPAGDAEMEPADVVFALVANRCLAPCSKLRVTEWAPRTALPELLGYEPDRLNNTRIHRVLDAMEGIEPALTRFLVQHPVRQEHGDGAVLFLDLTSSWFEGHGGTLGRRGRTKDGAIRRHTIQIALAVDGQGLPIRWDVLPGNTFEAKVLPDWLAALKEHKELDSHRLVFDRGLATEENIGRLLREGRQFVTCSRLTNIDDWGMKVDFAALASMPAGKSPTPAALAEAGLQATSNPDIYFVDLGVQIPEQLGSVPPPGVRVIPYFRPSLFERNRESLVRLRANVDRQIDALNDELRNAKVTRKEPNTRKKVRDLLERFQLLSEYEVHLTPVELPGKKKPVGSFQVRLERVAEHGARDLNAGWMILFAHPSDPRPPLELIEQYHQKAVVEHDFGVIKSFIELRPIRHHKDARIRAHVTLCVLALLLDRYLELRLARADITDAVDRVYEQLEPCRLQVLSGRGRNMGSQLIITDTTSAQRALLRALGLENLAHQEATTGLTRRRRY
ncbi:MAG: transposase [Alphaproteobacteria bacterium]|nr:transposase [Alphaproteobacteria bacterium]